MAHNAVKPDCHYLQIDLAGPWGPFNEKCSLTVGWLYLCYAGIFYSFDASTCFIAPLCSLSAYHTLTFILTSLLVLCLLARLQLCCASVCLSASSQPLCLPGPVGRFMTGVALVKPSSGIKWQRVRQALSHYAGPPILALIESSDPKLMGRGAGAHLLSTVDVLRRQTSEQQWQCWICSVDSDTLLHTLAHLLISHSGFAVVSKGPGLVQQMQMWASCALH